MAIFLHVGSQILAIDSIIIYAQGMGISLMEAKSFPSYTLFATICGYLLGIALIPRRISQLNALRFCTLLGVMLSLLVVTSTGDSFFLGHHADISIWFLVMLGICQFHDLGRYMAIGVGQTGNPPETGCRHTDHGT